jgi:hypothetical protein
LVDVAYAHVGAGFVGVSQVGEQAVRVHPHAVVLHADQGLVAVVLCHDRDRAAARFGGDSVLHGVLHQRLQHQERDHHGQDLWRDLDAYVQALGVALALDGQVAVDVAQLVGQRRELAGGPERVPREVGELLQQVSRSLGVRPDQGADRVQRVVQEVRRDLCPQHPHLGFCQLLLRLVQFRQLQLDGDELGHLVRGSNEALRVDAAHHDQRALDLAVRNERHDHGRAHRAAASAGAAEVRVVDVCSLAVADRQVNGAGQVGVVLVGAAGPRQEATVGVRYADGHALQHLQEMLHRLVGGLLGQAAAQFGGSFRQPLHRVQHCVVD